MDSFFDMNRPDGGRDGAIDEAVLGQILSIGDAGMRHALLDQLLADFHRLAETLTGGSSDEVGAAAHEIKGLAATIGAHRLAQLAKRLDTVADCAVPAEIGKFRSPIECEIRTVLDSLAQHAGRARPDPAPDA